MSNTLTDDELDILSYLTLGPGTLTHHSFAAMESLVEKGMIKVRDGVAHIDCDDSWMEEIKP